VPRFHKQLADDILRRSVPLNWFGAIETEKIGKQETVDLKLRGTAIFVDVARLQSLAYGIPETGTRRRFEAIARERGIEPQRGEAWCSAFEFLQMLRLRVQLDGEASAGGVPGHPNKVELAALNDIDRRLLKESLRIARRLQRRVELDYGN
jgi:CBS domain-containing protein